MHLKTSPLPHPHWRPAAVALAAVIALTACGGSGDSPTSSGGTDATVTAFPTGVALSSPASLDNTSSVVASAVQAVPMDVRMADWGRTMWQALQNGDTRTAATLMLKLLPMSNALAAPTKVPEGAVVASEIESVAKGTRALSHPGLLSITDLFSSSVNNATCFGPGISYTGHDNWTGATMMHPSANGSLPSGDLGMWTASSTDNFGTVDVPNDITQPCAIAQLNKRLDGTKKQVRQAMLLMAGMRRLVQTSSTLSMPTAGNSTDVQSRLAATLATIPAMTGTTVDAATVSLNGGGTIYTYRLALSIGSGASAKQGEIVIQHTPGGSPTEFAGVLQLTTSDLRTDPAFGCSDEITNISSTQYYKVATVTTTRYNRNGTSLDVGARSGRYCGAPAPGSSNHIGDLAMLDSDGMLDFATDLGGSNTRGGVKGWRSDASRFGATMDTDTQAGHFIYLWQAGNLDSLSRAFAVHTEFNSSTEARTLNAYFAFSNPIDSTTANLSLRGMVCNWAGPGNSQTPTTLFQSQSASLSSTATTWTLDASKIAYAPTTTCDSTAGMNYDVNADTIVTMGEGASIINDLDTLNVGNATVADELIDRGVSKPNLF